MEDEPLFALSDADLKALHADQDMLQFERTVFVSEEVRQQCLTELELGRKTGYILRNKIQ